MVLRRKTGRADTDGIRSYKQALEDLNSTVEEILELACGGPASDIARCRESYHRIQDKCAKLSAEKEGLLVAQRERDQQELRLLRTAKEALLAPMDHEALHQWTRVWRTYPPPHRRLTR